MKRINIDEDNDNIVFMKTKDNIIVETDISLVCNMENKGYTLLISNIPKINLLEKINKAISLGNKYIKESKKMQQKEGNIIKTDLAGIDWDSKFWIPFSESTDILIKYTNDKKYKEFVDDFLFGDKYMNEEGLWSTEINNANFMIKNLKILKKKIL